MVGTPAVPLPPLRKVKGVNGVASPPVTLKPITKNDLNLRYCFTDDHGVPYANTGYIAYLHDGIEKQGITDKEGYTEVFYSQEVERIIIHLFEKNMKGMPTQLKENDSHNLRYRFTDEAEQPYKNIEYVAYYPDGKEIIGITDDDGYTETFEASYEKKSKYI